MSTTKKKDNPAKGFWDRGKVMFTISVIWHLARTYQMKHYAMGKLFPLFLVPLLLFHPSQAHTSDTKVLLLPVALYADTPLEHVRKGVDSMLSSRLAGGGIRVVSSQRIGRFLTEKEKEGISSEKRAEELTRKLESDFAVFGSITAIGDSYSLDLGLVHLEAKKTPRITRVSKTADKNQFIPVLSEAAGQLRATILGKEVGSEAAPKPPEKPKGTPPKEVFSKLDQETQQPLGGERDVPFKPTLDSRDFTPTGSIRLNMAVMSFDIGDLDGDGAVELVIIDRKKMLVYERHKDQFVLQDTRKASWGEEFFKVSVADIDRNGMEEIYVVALYGKRARTTVFERAQEFRKVVRKTGHIRAIKNPTGRSPFLLFQGSELNEFFSGPMYHLNYDTGGSLTKGKELPAMKGAQFYTLMPFELDEAGSRGWLGLGEPNLYKQAQLHLWGKRGEVLWKGEKDLGGTNNAVRAGEKEDPEGLEPRVPFDSRLTFIDIDGDGEREVVALANKSIIKHTQEFKVYTKSSLIAYERQGLALSPGWETAEIDYCITELQASGQALFLAAHKGKVLNIGKESGVIMWVE